MSDADWIVPDATSFSLALELMQTEFPTISPDADLFGEGGRVLQESGLRAIPVVKDNELVGMLTVEDIGQADLLRSFRRRQE